ncbi:YciI family protein [Flavobacterium sp.]|uniref:YciI family protein n=2 Tax=Flavobacterium sp. TaxID=239 RepID=UPI004047F517
MKKIFLFGIIIISFSTVFSQENKDFDAKLAKDVGADDYGMKTYVFCILKTGTNSTATAEERQKYFEGHMANINKLADEKKLVVAGPFMKNDKNYRGIFIFNCTTIEEAKALVDSDPAVAANIFEAELTLWYSSAALLMVNENHNKIAKTKI